MRLGQVCLEFVCISAQLASQNLDYTRDKQEFAHETQIHFGCNPFHLFINIKLEVKTKQFCGVECYTLQQNHSSHISHIVHRMCK